MPRWYGVEVVLGNLVIWYLLLHCSRALTPILSLPVLCRAMPCWCCGVTTNYYIPLAPQPPGGPPSPPLFRLFGFPAGLRKKTPPCSPYFNLRNPETQKPKTQPESFQSLQSRELGIAAIMNREKGGGEKESLRSPKHQNFHR